MSKGLKLDYHYGSEADQYTFYRLPKALFTDRYKGLSDGAKILYGLMLDRMSLSIKNGWEDELGRVYIIFTVEDVQEYMDCSRDKGMKMFAELSDEQGVGLIKRIRQGQGNPSIIYVKKFIEHASSQRSEKSTSRSRKNRPLEVDKTDPNKNEYNKTEKNDTESIFPSISPAGVTEGFVFERDHFFDQIEYHRLHEECVRPELLEELVALMEDIFQSTALTQRVNGEGRPTSAVQGQLMKLGPEHILHVLDQLQENTVPVRNMRNYLLTALYNAPMMAEHSMFNKTQRDLYGKTAPTTDEIERRRKLVSKM